MSTSAPVSTAVASRLASLRQQGSISADEAAARGGRLVATEHGGTPADQVRLSLLVSSQDLVLDAKVATQAAGALLAAYDAMAELCVGRPLVALTAITPRAIDAHLGGTAEAPALSLGLDADQSFYVLRKAAERPAGVAAAAPAGAPAAADQPFAQCGLFEKVRRIEAVLDAYVRPALASDGGGIDLVDLRGDTLQVMYQGACGSCSSSVGGTLQFVQDSLANHLAHPIAVEVVGMEEPPFAV